MYDLSHAERCVLALFRGGRSAAWDAEVSKVLLGEVQAVHFSDGGGARPVHDALLDVERRGAGQPSRSENDDAEERFYLPGELLRADATADDGDDGSGHDDCDDADDREDLRVDERVDHASQPTSGR